MTYLHRLARRIARLRSPLALMAAVAAACSQGDRVDFLSPNPNKPALKLIRIQPKIASAELGSEIQFSATGLSAAGEVVPAAFDWNAEGGSITPDGRYVGESVGAFRVVVWAHDHTALRDTAFIAVWENPIDPIALIVSPDSAVLVEADSLDFTAALSMASGIAAAGAEVSWSASGGQIDSSGRFTAAESGTYTVTATSVNGLRGSASVFVRRREARLGRVSVDPRAPRVTPGQGLQFAATAHWTTGAPTPAEVQWSATGGSISPGGWFTAGSREGDYQVVARAVAANLTDTATITIANEVVGLEISPKQLSLQTAAGYQFTALSRLGDGSWQQMPVGWQATGGTITSDGHYTAGSLPGSYRVIATVGGTSLSDTAVVLLVQPPATLDQILLNPSSATVPTGSTRQFTATGVWSDGSSSTPSVTWSATGGSISAGGLFTAGSNPGTFQVTAAAGNRSATSVVTVTPPVLVSLQMQPGAVTLTPPQTQQFTVSATWSDGGTAAPQVSWSAAGGTITTGGIYTAGSAPGTYQVTAAAAGSTLAVTSLVTISAPATLIGVLLTPASVVLAPAGVQQFNAVGLMSDGSTASIGISWSATGGTVNSSGRYTAGSTAGTFRIIARRNGGTMADTSQIVITAPATLTTLAVAPKPVSLQVRNTQQFTVSGTWSNGSTATPSVVWTATGGSIASGGLYTAGSTPGTYRVIANQQGGTKADTAAVTLTTAPPPPPPTLTALNISPKSLSLVSGSTRQFSASALWSDGTTVPPPVTWTATGGAVTIGGLYTAGSSPGTYRVIVAGGAKADTAAVTVTAAPPVLQSLTVSPKPVSMWTGGTKQFAVSAAWSDGSATLPAITWTATGGSITTGGAYTAGSTVGNFRVIASGGGKADTASITLAAPVVTQFDLTPASATVAAGATQQFQTSAIWSDGVSRSVTVAYSATGGSISVSGLYTAAQVAGTFAVIATCGCGKLDTAVVFLTAPAAPTLTSIQVTPKPVSLGTGGTQQFSAAATWSDGSTTLPAITWSATGGSITPLGLYTGGSTAGNFRAIASGGGKADTASVTLVAPTLTGLTVSPKPVSMWTGGTKQFSVSAVWSDGSTTLPAITWSATGGTITAGGLYAAASTAGNFRVIGSGGGRADTASVSLLAPTLSSLTVSPNPVSMWTGGTKQFAVSATWSDGSTILPAITWSATGGTITTGGLYTAGATAGNFRAIASGGGKADTASVTLSAPVVTQFDLTPASATVAAGATQQFQTSATWSDGVSRSVSVTYSATGGSVSVSGLYTAGQVVGTFAVIAACSCGKADTSSVQVIAPIIPVLTSLLLTPKPVAMYPGGTQQFSASALWSDGGTTPPPLTWSATGGTITTGGLYTAGDSVGSFRVMASGAGRADTAAVDVQSLTAATPIVTFDPQNYSTTVDLLAAAVSWDNIDATHVFIESGATLDRITLESGTGYGGRTKFMRYNFPIAVQQDYTTRIALAIKDLPSTNLVANTELWVEVAVRPAANFYTAISGNSITVHQYKLLFLQPFGSGRWDMNVWQDARTDGVFGDWAGLIEVNGQAHLTVPDILDGQWHRIRWHAKTGTTDGIAAIQWDNTMVVNKQGNTGTKSDDNWYIVTLGANSNNGFSEPTTMDWGLVRVYTSNPGWGF